MERTGRRYAEGRIYWDPEWTGGRVLQTQAAEYGDHTVVWGESSASLFQHGPGNIGSLLREAMALGRGHGACRGIIDICLSFGPR